MFCFFFVPSPVSAQEKTYKKEKKEYYIWFDEAVKKEHLPLYNGIGYVEKYKVINTYHKFFGSVDFLKGSLLYDGQMYPNLEMKYDLYEDLVLLNLKKGQRAVLLQPDQEKIESFEINGNYFIHLRDSTSKAREVSGYYQLLFEGIDFQLLEKHMKKRFERKGKNALYSEFKSRNKNYLHYKGGLYVLDSRKDFENIFPDFKKDIQAFSKKRFPKENKAAHLVALSRKVDDLIKKSKSGGP